MGARVIKVEPLTGDPYRRSGLEYCPLGAGKESIGVDLKTPEGRAIVHRLVKGADGLVHSFRPGVPQRLGLDYETLSAINPRLVYLYGGSYGSKGPQSHRPAMHSTPHALTGGGILQAGVGNPPVDDSYPDPVAGLAAASGLLMGLWSRERTGRGQYLETTMIASSGFVHSDRLTFHDGRADDFAVDGGQHGYEATYRLYECADGWLFVAAVQQPEWEALCTAVGQQGLMTAPRFATVGARRVGSDELTKLLGEVFAAESADVWQARLLAAGVPAVRADTDSFPDFLLANGLLVAEEHPSFGPYWRMPAKVGFERRTNTLKPASSLGEFTEPILRELGYESADIAKMTAAGIVC
jgi:crotonobetainyl-CoA:carnitine CoA-transferase CaiB-like acyl-CoA transferase